MVSDAPAILRALEGLRDFSGRVVAVVGPPASGKSAVLQRVGDASQRLSSRVVRLRGEYADRAIPFAGLVGLRGGAKGDDVAAGDGEEPLVAEEAEAPMAPVAVHPDALPRSHRRRIERARSPLFSDAARPRSAEAIDLATYWEELLAGFRGPEARPTVVLVDDAAYLDPDSRHFLLSLGSRARLRPLLIVLALDTNVADTSLWLEALRARPETDWVHQPDSAPDAREVRRYRDLVTELPEKCRRLVGYLALLGGDAPDHLLSRIAKLGYGPLADQLKPATDRGLVRLRDGRFTFPDRAAPAILSESLPEEDRAVMHGEIAAALEALSPEPTLARRIEVAHHYLAAQPGAAAMAHLAAAAEVCFQQLEFATAADLLDEAFGCLVLVPPAERRTLEPEIRLALSRALFYSGRPAEAEGHLREGVGRALESGRAPAELANAIEPLVLAMRAAGARTSLVTTLAEVSERCEAAGAQAAALLLEMLRTELLSERDLFPRAEEAALRVAREARHRPERDVQAIGLLAMGLARTRSDRDDVFPADRFLRSAHRLLSNANRWELDYLVAELEVRLLAERGDLEQARALREASLTVLASEALPSVELAHHIGLASIDLDNGNHRAAAEALEHASRLIEKMHLLPPSPYLLGHWLLQGRLRVKLGEFDAAREYWSALVDLPEDASLPRFRAEALVRQGLLTAALGQPEEAAALGVLPPVAAELTALPPRWRRWLSDGPESPVRPDLSASRLPPPPPGGWPA